MIQFTCKKCKKTYKVNEDYAGKRVRCKPCGTINEIPRGEPYKIGYGDSLAAYNRLLEALSEDEKTAPDLESND